MSEILEKYLQIFVTCLNFSEISRESGYKLTYEMQNDHMPTQWVFPVQCLKEKKLLPYVDLK